MAPSFVLPVRLAVSAVALATLPLVVAPAAHADAPPVITEITTANESGGLTPYIPLYTTVRVTFSDSTPSAASDYRVTATGEGFSLDAMYIYGSSPGKFEASVDAYQLPVGEPLEFTVTELDGGEPVATSTPEAFTFTFVDHPAQLSTSSKMVNGRLSYKAGRTAKLSFTGEWEIGTLISTQVFVSKRKKFTGADWDRNVYGKAALVKAYRKDAPVLAFKIPKRLKGSYVWVSVLGWKPGEGGWTFQMKREYVR